MKVAVSIPDNVFAEAESLARRLNTSRSELYSRALHAYVGDHASDHVTEAMNAVVDALGHDVMAPFTAEAARQRLATVEW